MYNENVMEKKKIGFFKGWSPFPSIFFFCTLDRNLLWCKFRRDLWERDAQETVFHGRLDFFSLV